LDQPTTLRVSPVGSLRTIILVRELGPYLFRVVGRGLRRAAEERGRGMSVH